MQPVTIRPPTRHMLFSYLEDICTEFPVDTQRRGLNRRWKIKRFLLSRISDVLRDRTDIMDYLDLGAGAGVIPLVLAKAGLRVTAVDNWAEYADEYNNIMGTRAQFVELFRKYQVRTVEFNLLHPPLPLPRESFGLITLIDVLEHLPRPRAVVDEVIRLLQPNGIFIVKLPNTANLRNRLRLLMGRSPHPDDILEWFSEPFFGHYREMTMSEVKRAMHNFGFEIIKAEYTSACHYNTRYPNDRWGRTLEFNSMHQLAKVIYLATTALVPSWQYEIFLVAMKRM